MGAGLVEPVRAWLDEMSAEDLAQHLIGGLAFDEVPDDAGGPFLSALRGMDDYPFLLSPLPNTQFTRDNSAWVFQGVTLNPMFWPVRRQETLLTAAIYRFHPAFADEDFPVWFGDPDQGPVDHGAASLEGGDVMPVGHGTLVVGMGERTSQQAVTHKLARALFKADAVERVVVAALPRSRAAMHLDTVFTFCDRDVVTAFTPVVDRIRALTLLRRRRVTRRHDGAPRGRALRRGRREGARRAPPCRRDRGRTGSARAASSGTTGTTSSPSNRASSSATTATRRRTPSCAAPASRSSPSTPASSDVAAVVAGA